MQRSVIAGEDCPETDCAHGLFFHSDSSSFEAASDSNPHILTMNGEEVHREVEVSDSVRAHHGSKKEKVSFMLVESSSLMGRFPYDGVLGLAPGNDRFSMYEAFKD